MKSTRKSQPSKLNSILNVSDPFSGIELPVSSERAMSKTTKYKGANKALRLLLLVESWHVYAEHLILLLKKNSSRRFHASNSLPEPDTREGHHEPAEFTAFQRTARTIGCRKNCDGQVVADITLFREVR